MQRGDMDQPLQNTTTGIIQMVSLPILNYGHSHPPIAKR